MLFIFAAHYGEVEYNSSIEDGETKNFVSLFAVLYE